MISFHYDKVYERDMDFLIMDEFCENESFAALFLQQVGLSAVRITDVYHSLSEISLGESDIVIIVQKGDKRTALLIEDKIDAIAMDDQAGRYQRRAEKLIRSGDADAYHIFMTAPLQYLQTNDEAHHYSHQVSYESMLALYSNKTDVRSQRLCQMITRALDEQKQGYMPIEHVAVTEFWREYYAFKSAYYPQLILPELAGPRGEKAKWPSFKTANKEIRVIHKSLQGYVDLELPGLGNYTDLLQYLLTAIMDDDMHVVRTTKAASIRLMTPPIDFKQPFRQYINEMHQSLKAVERLCEIAKHINLHNLNKACSTTEHRITKTGAQR